MKRLSQRYLVATIAFAIAAIWLNMQLTSALECLIVFVLAYAIVGVVRRDDARVGARRHEPRRARARPAARRGYESQRRPPVSPRSTRAVYDLDRHAVADEWAQAADGGW